MGAQRHSPEAPAGMQTLAPDLSPPYSTWSAANECVMEGHTPAFSIAAKSHYNPALGNPLIMGIKLLMYTRHVPKRAFPLRTLLTSSPPTARSDEPLRLPGTAPAVLWRTQGSVTDTVKGLPRMGMGSAAPSSVCRTCT